MKYLSLLLIVFFLTSNLALAQNKLSSDRVGFGSATYSIPVSAFQLESGVQFSEDLYDIGQFLLRTGLTEQLELRISAGSVLYNSGSESSTIGVQSAGLKYGLGNISESFALALNANLELPFLNENYEHWLFTLFVLADYSISEQLGINASLGYGNFVDGIDDGNTYLSVTPTYSLNDKNEVSAGFFVEAANDENQTSFEAGYSYYFSNDFSGDVQVITGDSNTSIGVGVSVRF